MSERKVVYQSNVVALPPLKMVLGEVPSPNPKRDSQLTGLEKFKSNSEVEGIVTKLITHFKEDRK
jgi:hypothetical protein